MVSHFKKYLFVILLASFVLSASASASLINYEKGRTPEEIGVRLVKNLLNRKDYMLYENDGLHYAEACTGYSAYRFAALAGNKELLAELNKRYGSVFDANRLISKKPHVDQAVIGILPLEIFMRAGDKKFLEQGLSFADRQWQDPQADGLTSQTRWWIDDMYMVGMLQMQAYRATGEIKYADRAALQIAAYLKKLQQPSGLFYHGPGHPFYWGRGNGWVASALTEVLKSLPQNHPERSQIMDGYLKMMATLLKNQSENGMWRQLIDYQPAWPESSCTAMFTYAMITGVKYGWLKGDEYRPAVQKAWDALCAHLDGQANLGEICIGTGQGDNIKYYLNRPKVSGDLHGQAPLLWCVCELLDTNLSDKSDSAVQTAKQTQQDKKGGNAMEIKITSSAFAEGGMIPLKYTCDGQDISPPLEWDAVPEGTKSIALISEDPDAPMGTWVHWVIFGLPAETRKLEENIPPDKTLPNGARQGTTDFGRIGYGGPCPPSGTHRYYFKIYALDTELDLAAGARKGELLKAMEGHILAQGQLIGKYKRK
jgi:Raf kinase inhibitor-like YbhB/YbcL family protein